MGGLSIAGIQKTGFTNRDKVRGEPMTWEFKDYYKENREKLLARRRKRYQTDPEYRKLRQRDALGYYNRKVKRAVPSVRTILYRRGRKYFTIGLLAKFIHRDEDTIRRYHRSGILPPTTVKHKDGWRLYTEAQVNLLQRAFQLLDQEDKKINLQTLRDLVRRKWRVVNENASTEDRPKKNTPGGRIVGRVQNRSRAGAQQPRKN